MPAAATYLARTTREPTQFTESPETDMLRSGIQQVTARRVQRDQCARRHTRERLARSASAERVQQPDPVVDRRAAVPGCANRADPAVFRALPAAEPVLRHLQQLRAAPPSLRRGRGEFLNALSPTGESIRSASRAPRFSVPRRLRVQTFATGQSRECKARMEPR
jgi:hypothetical protein